MLSEKFFEEYAKTYEHPKLEEDGTLIKDTYTRAEVDELITKRLEEALKNVGQVQYSPEPEKDPDVEEDSQVQVIPPTEE